MIRGCDSCGTIRGCGVAIKGCGLCGVISRGGRGCCNDIRGYGCCEAISGSGSGGDAIRGRGVANRGRGWLDSAIRGAGGDCPMSGRSDGDTIRGQGSPGTIRGRGCDGKLRGCGNSGFLSATEGMKCVKWHPAVMQANCTNQ